MFRPFGNLVRLPDGRTLKKQANGMWIDVNSGVKMNDTMVGNLMYSSVFYGVPDGGVGKDTPRFVVGIAGSFTITNWLNDAKNGIDSVDFAWIGDSNTIRCNLDSCTRSDPQGLVDHFMTAGVSAGIKIYGTPIYAANKPNSSGYKTSASGIDPAIVGRGWTSGFTYGPAHLTNQFSAGGGRFTPNYDSVNGANLFARDGYCWLPEGKTAFAGINLSIQCTGGFQNIGYSAPLTLRFLAGTTGNTGGILPIEFIGSTGGQIRVTTQQITFTGGFTAFNITLPNRPVGLTAASIYFSGQNGNGFFATGPVALSLNSAFSTTDKGMASSALFGAPGISLGGMYEALLLAGSANNNATIINMLSEFHNRQKAAGGSGRVCVTINGGVNLDNGATNQERITNSETFIKNIVSTIQTEWTTANLPSDKLTFLVFNTWTGEPSSTWSTILPTIVGDLKLYANNRSNNITYVDMLTFAGTFDGLTAAGYYDQTSNAPTPAHLSNGLTGGYHFISDKIFTALLKQRNTNK